MKEIADEKKVKEEHDKIIMALKRKEEFYEKLYSYSHRQDVRHR